MDAKVAAQHGIRTLAGKTARVVLAVAFAVLALAQLGHYAASHSRMADLRAAFAADGSADVPVRKRA